MIHTNFQHIFNIHGVTASIYCNFAHLFSNQAMLWPGILIRTSSQSILLHMSKLKRSHHQTNYDIGQLRINNMHELNSSVVSFWFSDTVGEQTQCYTLLTKRHNRLAVIWLDFEGLCTITQERFAIRWHFVPISLIVHLLCLWNVLLYMNIGMVVWDFCGNIHRMLAVLMRLDGCSDLLIW